MKKTFFVMLLIFVSSFFLYKSVDAELFQNLDTGYELEYDKRYWRFEITNAGIDNFKRIDGLAYVTISKSEKDLDDEIKIKTFLEKEYPKFLCDNMESCNKLDVFEYTTRDMLSPYPKYISNIAFYESNKYSELGNSVQRITLIVKTDEIWMISSNWENPMYYSHMLPQIIQLEDSFKTISSVPDIRIQPKITVEQIQKNERTVEPEIKNNLFDDLPFEIIYGIIVTAIVVMTVIIAIMILKNKKPKQRSDDTEKSKTKKISNEKSPFQEILNEISKECPKKEPEEKPTSDKKHTGIYDKIIKNKNKIKQDLGKLNSEEKRIITSDNSFDVLGISPNADFADIKKRWKELSIKYNASRGALTKSPKEIAKFTAIQIIINRAWEEIRGTRK